MAKIAELIVDLSANVAQFNEGMQRSAESVHKLQESFESAKKGVEHFVEALAIGEAIRFVKEAVSATQEWAFSIQKLSQLTGLSAESAGTFIGIAKEEGVSTDVVTTAIGRLSLALASHPQKFKDLGVAIRDASGQLLPMQQILGNTVTGLDTFKIGADRDAASALLLGKGFAGLLPDLERLGPALNPANFERMREFLDGLGLAIDSNGISKAREWEKAQVDLGLEFLAIQNQIGSALLPIITKFGEKVGEYARDGSLKRWAIEASEAFLSLGLAVVHLGEYLIENRTIIELALEGFGAVNIAEGHFVAGTAEMAAGVALANANLEGMSAGLKKTESALTSAKKVLSTPDVFPATTITGGDPPGAKSFNVPDKATAAALEKFEKLRNELTAQKALQEALSAAWKRGGVDVQDLTNKFNAYKASLALGKDNTDAQREAIRKLNLETARGADQVKIDESISKFSKTAGDAIAFQNRLTAAYNQGGFAVERLTDQQHAYNAALTLGLNATDAERKAIFDRDLAQSQATHNAQRAAQLLGVTDSINENIRAQNALAGAYNSGGRSIIAITDLERAYQAELALGKNATDAEREAVFKLSIQESAAIRATSLAKQTNDDLVGSIKEAGSALANAFSAGLKPGSDYLRILEDLGAALEEIVLKATLLRPLERALDSYFSGPSAASLAPGAASSLFAPPPSIAPAAPQIDFGTLITNGFETSAGALENIMGGAIKGSEPTLGASFSTAFQSSQGTLSSIFGDIFKGLGSLLGSLFGGGGGAGIADDLGGLLKTGSPTPSLSRASSTNLGNPVSPNFRPPDVRASSSASINQSIHLHGEGAEKATVQRRRGSTGEEELHITLDRMMAQNVQRGGQFEKANRVTSGIRRQAIER